METFDVTKLTGLELHKAIKELHSWDVRGVLPMGIVSEWNDYYKIQRNVLKAMIEHEFFRRFTRHDILFNPDGTWENDRIDNRGKRNVKAK